MVYDKQRIWIEPKVSIEKYYEAIVYITLNLLQEHIPFIINNYKADETRQHVVLYDSTGNLKRLVSFDLLEDLKEKYDRC